MAQTRLEKIGTIYSRLLGLYKSGAAKHENRPIWFDIYEAFPPKYEPRWDRHQLNYGTGGNVAILGPPSKILYKEDVIRAQFYKVFGGEGQEILPGEIGDNKRKIKITHNLFDNDTENIAQKFINKYYELEKTTPVASSSERNLFRETVEALELEGISLLNPRQDIVETNESEGKDDTPQEVSQPVKRPSLKEIFQRESERTSKDD